MIDCAYTAGITGRLATRTLRNVVLGACLALLALAGNAWVLTITPGTRTVYLGVGNSTTNAANATINLVSVAVAAGVVGTGALQAMTSNSTQAVSPYDAFTVCTPLRSTYP